MVTLNLTLLATMIALTGLVMAFLLRH